MAELIILTLSLSVLIWCYKNNMIISSTSIWAFCYIFIFCVSPYVINERIMNKELIQITSLLGIMFFIIGVFLKYYITKNISLGANILKNRKLNPDKAEYILIILFVMFISVLFYTYSPTIIIDLLSGNLTARSLAREPIMEIVLTILKLMFPMVMTVFIYSRQKNKYFKFIALLIYEILCFMFEYTRLFAIFPALIIFMYWSRSIGKKLQVLYSSILCVAVIVFMFIANIVRNLGLYGDFAYSDFFDLEHLISFTDFNYAYIFYDKLLSLDSPYIGILPYFKALFVFIPRFIWEQKPQTLNMELLYYIDPYLARAGYSTGMSILGEAYGVIGFLGIIVYPILWGYLCMSMDLAYYKRLKQNLTNISMYEIMYYIFCTYIIVSAHRGDWSGYMITIFWLYFVPMLFISYKDKDSTLETRNMI